MGVPVTYNLRNLVERKGTTLMTAVGIGLTVAVLVTSIAMTNGMNAVFAGSGHPLQVLVPRLAQRVLARLPPKSHCLPKAREAAKGFPRIERRWNRF